MKHILIALTLFVAAPVSAQSLLKPNAVFLATSAMDISSTAYCLSKPLCHEANPMLKWAEPHGTPMLVGVAVASDLAILYTLNRMLGRSHPRLLRVGLYAFSAARVYVAANNLREAQRFH